MKGWILKTLKKGFKSFLIDLGIVLLIICGIGAYLFFNPEVVSAQVYQPLAPIPGVTEKAAPDLGTFIQSIYRVSIGIGVVLAILMLVIAGLQYSASVIPSVKKGAKTRIQGALLGLLLLLSSVLILTTINPDLAVLELDLEPTDEVLIEGDTRTQEEIDSELLASSTVEFRGAYCQYSRDSGPSPTIKNGCFEDEEVCKAAARRINSIPGISAWCREESQ